MSPGPLGTKQPKILVYLMDKQGGAAASSRLWQSERPLEAEAAPAREQPQRARLGPAVLEKPQGPTRHTRRRACSGRKSICPTR